MINNKYLGSNMTLDRLAEIQDIKKNSPNEVINLSGNDFSRIMLPSLDLSGYSLRGINLNGCSTALDKPMAAIGADLTEALFADSILKGIRLNNAFVDDADFSDAAMSGGSFESMQGSNVNFRGAKLIATNFDYANLCNAIFEKALLNSSSFIDTTLESACFDGATMNYAQLSGVDAGYIDFERVRAYKLKISDSCMAQGSFVGAEIYNSEITKVELIAAQFNKAKLTEVDFSGSDLTDVDFSGCILENCKFDGAKLQDTNFVDAILINTDTSGENFKEAKMKK